MSSFNADRLKPRGPRASTSDDITRSGCIKITEIALQCGVTVDCVKTWVRRGFLRAIGEGNGAQIPLDSWEKFLDDNPDYRGPYTTPAIAQIALGYTSPNTVKRYCGVKTTTGKVILPISRIADFVYSIPKLKLRAREILARLPHGEAFIRADS